MNIIFIILGYVVWTVLAVLYLGNKLTPPIKENKTYWTYFSLLVIGYFVLGFFPIRFVAGYFAQDQMEVFVPRKNWSHRPKHELTDVFPQRDGSIKAVFLDLESRTWSEKRITKDGVGDVNLLQPMSPFQHAPWNPYKIGASNVLVNPVQSVIKEDALVRLKDDEIQVSAVDIPGNVASWDGTGIYFTQKGSVFFHLYYYDHEDSLTSKLPIPTKGHFYNTYYWKSAEMLFYTGLIKGKKGYLFNLYMQKGEENVITRPLKSMDELNAMPLVKISGNENGRLFVVTDSFSESTHMYDMNFYPFDVKKLIQEGGTGFELGYKLILPEVSKVRSAVFHPTLPYNLSVLGESRDGNEPLLVDYTLTLEKKGSFFPNMLDWIISLIGIAVSFFLLFQLKTLIRLEK